MSSTDTTVRRYGPMDPPRLHWLARRFLKAQAWHDVASGQLEALAGPALELDSPIDPEREERWRRADDLVIRIEATIIELVAELVGDAPASMKVGNLVVAVVTDDCSCEAHAVVVDLDATFDVPRRLPTAAVA